MHRRLSAAVGDIPAVCSGRRRQPGRRALRANLAQNLSAALLLGRSPSALHQRGGPRHRHRHHHPRPRSAHLERVPRGRVRCDLQGCLRRRAAALRGRKLRGRRGCAQGVHRAG